eukprot:1620725-Prymnesium_polylepis.1
MVVFGTNLGQLHVGKHLARAAVFDGGIHPPKPQMLKRQLFSGNSLETLEVGSAAELKAAFSRIRRQLSTSVEVSNLTAIMS